MMYDGTHGLKEVSYKKCRLNNKYMAFYGFLYGHIAKNAFFIHGKTKDFLPIICLIKNKGFSTKL